MSASARALEASIWPTSRAGELLAALSRQADLRPHEVDLPPPPSGDLARDRAKLSEWIEAASTRIGVEAEPMQSAYGDVEGMLRGAGPALVALPGEGEPRLVALLAGRGAGVRLLGPDLVERSMTSGAIRDAVCAPIERDPAAAVDKLLKTAGVPEAHREKARAAILRERLGQARVGGVWALRVSPSAPFREEIRAAGLGRPAIALLGARAAEYCLNILSWWMIAAGALSGRLDRGYLFAWALVLVTQVPFRTLASVAQGQLAINAGAALKRRLLVGALALEPEEVRGDGAGALLGRVIESEAVESLSLRAGFEGLTAALELLIAGALLALGAGGLLSVLALIAVVACVLAIGASYLRRYRRWTDARVAMTHDLVERMVGHRTRVAQQLVERFHDGEDEAIERSLKLSQAVDSASVALSIMPRTFLLLGVASIAPAFASGASAGSIGVTLGAVLLAQRALIRFAGGVFSLVGARVAWEKVRPLLKAASRSEPAAEPLLALAHRADRGRALIDARSITFRYRERGRKILDGLSLRIAPGDRVLLEGGSGGGKSTLGSLLAGLRTAESGVLLLGGLDRKTLGARGFRRFVVSAPQFHENHVFSATFSFNLFMGGAYPPSAAMIAEGEKICEELGLGPLVARMPGGIDQMVGETGWQLSHGERSRLYIARALLQRAELIVLDESFAALDPATLERALRCVLARARAVLVIAHP